MANKKRKRPRNRPRAAAPSPHGSRPDAAPATERSGPARGEPSPARGGANPARRERKEEARAARERARKQVARRNATRRAVVLIVISAVALGAFYLLNRAASPGSLTDEVAALAADVGCSDVTLPADHAPGGQHLAEDESANYTQRPATSGFHAPSTLGTEQKVFTEAVREENAVHTLEHGGVLLYYRTEGEGAVGQDVIDRLAALAETKTAVFVSPHANLEEGDSLAFAAWNTLMTCPAGVSADDAATIAQGFSEAFECTSRAPEANISSECN